MVAEKDIMTPLTKELLRKTIHLLQFPIIAGYSFLHFYFSPKVGLLGLTALLLILLEIEYFRIDYQTKIKNQFTDFFTKFIIRNKEREHLSGAIFFIISSIISFAVFDYSIALCAVLFTILGDFAAAVMGTAFGKKKIFREKSYVGVLSGFIMNLIVGLLLIPDYPIMLLSMATTASIVETVTHKIDDNLSVPLFAGFVGQILAHYSTLGPL